MQSNETLFARLIAKTKKKKTKKKKEKEKHKQTEKLSRTSVGRFVFKT